MVYTNMGYTIWYITCVISHGCYITWYIDMVYNMVYMISNLNGIYRKLYAIYHICIP